jgi:hypothetical protein
MDAHCPLSNVLSLDKEMDTHRRFVVQGVRKFFGKNIEPGATPVLEIEEPPGTGPSEKQAGKRKPLGLWFWSILLTSGD